MQLHNSANSGNKGGQQGSTLGFRIFEGVSPFHFLADQVSPSGIPHISVKLCMS